MTTLAAAATSVRPNCIGVARRRDRFAGRNSPGGGPPNPWRCFLGQTGVNAEILGDLAESVISCPKSVGESPSTLHDESTIDSVAPRFALLDDHPRVIARSWRAIVGRSKASSAFTPV